MANDNKKQQGGRKQQQDKEPMEQPMRRPDEGNVDIEREKSSDRNRNQDSGVIENDEEVELGVDDLEEDVESDQITGRHPSQRDRDLK